MKVRILSRQTQLTHLDQAVGERDTTAADEGAGLLPSPFVPRDRIDRVDQAAHTVLVSFVRKAPAVRGIARNANDVPAFKCRESSILALWEYGEQADSLMPGLDLGSVKISAMPRLELLLEQCAVLGLDDPLDVFLEVAQPVRSAALLGKQQPYAFKVGEEHHQLA